MKKLLAVMIVVLSGWLVGCSENAPPPAQGEAKPISPDMMMKSGAKPDAPPADAPKEDAKADAPKEDAPPADAPKEEAKADAPKEEAKADAPKEEPKN